ncbi:MAG: TetR/AcrR family transcriptional regulator [Daejeonella sp.]|uniref:TetR/AcrR family transcriptional regulator n=1 Tax=unclassified Daejeonella TaxID=2805396 RepID=UPI0023ED44F6|nr:TetR/AcrR family transcriptional regulator [Daejeonella sp. JGW-45]
MEELIISKARELFFSNGIKSVSMDDISKGVAVSKKTIYKCFVDKNQLVERIVEDLIEGFKDRTSECRKHANNPIEEVVLFTAAAADVVANISASFFYQLKKFFPVIWRRIEDFQKNWLLPFITENLKQGINEEVYRPDINIPFTVDIRLQQILTVLDARTLIGRPMQLHKLMQLTEFYLHAIATPKGKSLIIKYLKADNET